MEHLRCCKNGCNRRSKFAVVLLVRTLLNDTPARYPLNDFSVCSQHRKDAESRGFILEDSPAWQEIRDKHMQAGHGSPDWQLLQIEFVKMRKVLRTRMESYAGSELVGTPSPQAERPF